MNPSALTSPSLLTVDGLVGVVFLIMVLITVVGGLIACNSERLVRSIAGLVVCFIGVAGLYFFLLLFLLCSLLEFSKKPPVPDRRAHV